MENQEKNRIEAATEQKPGDWPALMTGKTAAAYLGIAQSTFCRHRAYIVANHGLKTVRLGKSHLYPKTELDAMIKRLAERDESLIPVPSPSGSEGG